MAEVALAQNANGGSEQSIETITVTASRRAEAAKNVPITITAIAPEEMKQEQVKNLDDALAQVPGAKLQVGKGTSLVSLNIRGQSTSEQSPGLDPPVAFFEDDLYFGSPASFDTDFYDTAQIAVLKGPQGTTFGRNVVGGAMQVTNNRPELGAFDGDVRLTAENYSGFEAQGFVNAPIDDDLAARASFSYRRHTGYFDNVETGKTVDDLNKISGRVQLLWQPTSTFSADLLLSWQHTNNSGTASKFVGQGAWAATVAAKTGNDDHKIYDWQDGFEHREVGIASLHLDWQTDFADIQSITGFHVMKQDFAEDVDDYVFPIYTPDNNQNSETQASQEFRIISPAKQTFTYVAGLYADYNRSSLFFPIDEMNSPQAEADPNLFMSLLLTLTLPGFPCFEPSGAHCPAINEVFQHNTTKTVAPYFEGTWHITDKLDLTAGVRFTYTEKDGVVTHFGPNPFYGQNPFSANYDHSWYQWTPRAILDYHINDDVMLYVSASNGVKSGGTDFSLPTVALTQKGLRPENSWSFEAGEKGTFFDNMLSLNAAIYTVRTRDLQIRVLNGGAFVIANAGALDARGAELEADFRPIDMLDLGARYAYTDAYFGSFKNCTSAGADCTGNPAPDTPKHDLLLFAQYDYPIERAGDVLLRVQTHYASKYTTDPTGPSAILRSVYDSTAVPWVLDAALTYTSENSSWSAMAWGKNIFDRQSIVSAGNYYFYGLTIPEFLGGLRQADRVFYSNPRTYGVTLEYHF